MKNILILASGSIAKHFIDWIAQKRVAENHYYVTCYESEKLLLKTADNFTLITADPTSFSKLKRIMTNTQYSNIFIVMEDKEDAVYSLKNISLIESKTRIVLVNQWNDESIGKGYKNLSILHADKLMAAHLYDNLPNVPLIAQNVGLGDGEIMEIHIPFGSTYAYRHVGTIFQRKWKIVAIYRDNKQILTTHATMIRPNDRILAIGRPRVLDGIYKTVNKRIGLFPEPFGKNIYLTLDFRYDHENAVHYLKESIYLLAKLEKKSLYVSIRYPNNFSLISELREYESDKIFIFVCYDEENIAESIEYDIHQYDVGLVMCSMKSFDTKYIKEILYELNKLVYLFGKEFLYNVRKCVVLINERKNMESISSTALDISESLGLSLVLANYDPEGDFESQKMIIEHYETLTHIFNIELDIEQKIANPIRELSRMESILQIAPFEKEFNSDFFMKLISTKIQDFLLTSSQHPKLLVPFELVERREEV